MSSKPDKKKSEEKESPRTQAKAAPQVRPSGRVPTATVVARHGTGTVTRAGKGFSFGELSEANIVPRAASTWGVRLDGRRRSVLEANVTSLKNWGSHSEKPARAEREVRKVEEELVKVEKEIKKGAAEVRKEIVKIEAKAKKVTPRANKKVKKKAEKPAKSSSKKKTKK